MKWTIYMPNYYNIILFYSSLRIYRLYIYVRECVSYFHTTRCLCGFLMMCEASLIEQPYQVLIYEHSKSKHTTRTSLSLQICAFSSHFIIHTTCRCVSVRWWYYCKQKFYSSLQVANIYWHYLHNCYGY